MQIPAVPQPRALGSPYCQLRASVTQRRHSAHSDRLSLLCVQGAPGLARSGPQFLGEDASRRIPAVTHSHRVSRQEQRGHLAMSTHTHVHTQTHSATHPHACLCTYTHVHTRVRAFAHACALTCVRIHSCMCPCTQALHLTTWAAREREPQQAVSALTPDRPGLHPCSHSCYLTRARWAPALCQTCTGSQDTVVSKRRPLGTRVAPGQAGRLCLQNTVLPTSSGPQLQATAPSCLEAPQGPPAPWPPPGWSLAALFPPHHTAPSLSPANGGPSPPAPLPRPCPSS